MKHLPNIELFVKVVKEGNFSTVARSLEISPSAVSRQISQLEKELGGRLFQRTTRKQSLTEAGEIYFQHALQLVEDIEVAKLAVKGITDKPSGNLRITAEADFALAFIEPILPDFLALYPEVQICLHMSSNLQDLIDNNLDLAIRVGHLRDSSLTARKLADSTSIVCASPAYLRKYGEPTHPIDLKTHSCLSFNTQLGSNYWRFEAEQKPIVVPVNGRLNVNGVSFLRKAALNDLGIILIPTWVIRDELTQQRLIPVLKEFPLVPHSTPINAIFTHKRQLAPKTRALINFLSERIQKV
jgi:DNA-binding transcriptional LysR family regulator